MAMNDDDSVMVGQFDKSRAEEVRGRFCTFHGQRYFDLRAFVTNDTTGEKMPTKKGLALRPDLLEELRDLVDQAIAQRDCK